LPPPTQYPKNGQNHNIKTNTKRRNYSQLLDLKDGGTVRWIAIKNGTIFIEKEQKIFKSYQFQSTNPTTNKPQKNNLKTRRHNIPETHPTTHKKPIMLHLEDAGSV
jgi:hypothetical protein